MKTGVIAAISTVGAIVIIGAALMISGAINISPPMATSTTSHSSVGSAPSASSAATTTTKTVSSGTTTTATTTETQPKPGPTGNAVTSLGSTITVSNLTGHWVATPSCQAGNNDDNPAMSGNSTGSFVFTTTGGPGGNLTITSGHFTINGTTYTVTSGTVALNDGNRSGFGNGTSTNSSTFFIHVAGLHGNSTSTVDVGAIKLYVKAGTSEYLVVLGSPEGTAFNEAD